MSTTAIMNVSGALGTHRVKIEDLNATPVNAVLVGTAASTVYGIEVDCGKNSVEDVAIRLFDLAAPVVGTDDAECVVKGYRGRSLEYPFPDGIPFATALSLSATKEMGGTAGSSDPTGQVNVTLLMKDS